MKYYLCLPLSLFFSTIGFSQTPPTSTQVTFGRYGGQGQSCVSGRGICSFSATNNTLTKTTDNTVLKKINETTFVLQMSRTAISKEDEIQILGKNFSEIKENELVSFVQTEDLYVDNDALKNLNIDPKHNKIAAGNYTILFSKENLEILFILKSAQ